MTRAWNDWLTASSPRHFCLVRLTGTTQQVAFHLVFNQSHHSHGYHLHLEDRQPFASWVLNEETADWESPVGAAPELTQEEIDSRSFYRWDEDAYQADNTTGWVLETPPAPEEEPA